MNQIKVVKDCKVKPEVLVVTPLLPNHKISKKTKISLKRNDVDFVWLSSEGKYNIPSNARFAINWFTNIRCGGQYEHLPPYYLMIDRDVIAGRHMIDKLLRRLKPTPDIYAYAYASFEFMGHVNKSFPARPFDPNALMQHNYISSNSLFKTKVVLDEANGGVGFVTDDQYKRLLDWAFLLKLFYHGYIGVPCPEAQFVADSTADDISARSPEDYKLKHHRVSTDFVKPILEKYQQPPQPEPEAPTVQLEF